MDCDLDLEIVPASGPLPEPQFMSATEQQPVVKYPTLGRSGGGYSTLGRGTSSKLARNSNADYGTPSPARDNVVRYSTIGRNSRVSPTAVYSTGVYSPEMYSHGSTPQPIYAPGSTYSSGGMSNHSSYLDSDLANPRSLTLSNRSDLPLYD